MGRRVIPVLLFLGLLSTTIATGFMQPVPWWQAAVRIMVGTTVFYFIGLLCVVPDQLTPWQRAIARHTYAPPRACFGTYPDTSREMRAQGWQANAYRYSTLFMSS